MYYNYFISNEFLTLIKLFLLFQSIFDWCNKNLSKLKFFNLNKDHFGKQLIRPNHLKIFVKWNGKLKMNSMKIEMEKRLKIELFQFGKFLNFNEIEIWRIGKFSALYILNVTKTQRSQIWRFTIFSFFNFKCFNLKTSTLRSFKFSTL